jgi:MFS superfamily sulfate permease-like transporter
MTNDVIFHGIEIAIQSGLLTAVVLFIWRASAVVHDFHGVKELQEKHIEEDKDQFHAVNTSLTSLEKGVARIEGRLNGR